MISSKSVLIIGALCGACTTPTREPGEARRAGQSPAVVPPTAAGPSRASSAATVPAPPASANPHPRRLRPSASATATTTGSAYFGCGAPIAVDKLWDETTESEVLEAITVAKQCAAAQDRRLLLEFVAPWCEDCREMAKLDETAVVSETMRERFERVRINVGKWDRHEALRENYRVRALATYVVIDPKTSRVLAQTTLEPITKKRGKKLTAEDWAAWLKTN